MSASVDNGFLHVHEQPGELEEALRDSLTLFIVIDDKGDAYVEQAGNFLLPQCSTILKYTSPFSPEAGNISFMGWFISPDAPHSQIPLSTNSALRPGLSAIFTIRVTRDILVDIAQQVNGSVTPSKGLTSLYPWPGVGALLQGVMLAKFISTYVYCSKCGRKLTMRNDLGLAQICRNCVREYFLPIRPYVCGVVLHTDTILLINSLFPEGSDWILPLMEVDVCGTPINALISGLHDLTFVDLQPHAYSIDMLNLTISVPDIFGLVTVYKVVVDAAFKLQNEEHARWFTKEASADILIEKKLGEGSVNGFILSAWINGTLDKHITKVPAPFDRVKI